MVCATHLHPIKSIRSLHPVHRLTYRAWQVFQKPVPELIEKLALDIPPAPELILERIQATEVRISWKQPDVQSSTTKHSVYVDDKRGAQYFFALRYKLTC